MASNDTEKANKYMPPILTSLASVVVMVAVSVVAGALADKLTAPL